VYRADGHDDTAGDKEASAQRIAVAEQSYALDIMTLAFS
jgi:hypothetical protein